MLKRLILVVATAALASTAAVGVASAAEPADGPSVTLPTEPAAVTITEDTSPSDAPCLPPLLALQNVVQDTPEAFSLRILVTAPLCEPVEAAAVVYAMPGKGVAWPQRLVERVDFTLKDPGTVVVRFAKECDPVQFDVITGASPAVISPDGAWHGPLLFPLDVGTALQFWGDGPDCPSPTTTTTSTTSTTTTSSTTSTTTTSSTTSTTTTSSTTSSTTTPSVLPSTTVQTAPSTTAAVAAATTINNSPTAPAAAVAGVSSTRGAAVAAGSLALTGSQDGDLARLGLILLGLGLGLGLLARRRPTPAAD